MKKKMYIIEIFFPKSLSRRAQAERGEPDSVNKYKIYEKLSTGEEDKISN